MLTDRLVESFRELRCNQDKALFVTGGDAINQTYHSMNKGVSPCGFAKH
jgi:hypothetical protein